MMTSRLPNMAARMMVPRMSTLSTMITMSSQVRVPSNTPLELAAVAVYSSMTSVASEEAISDA